MFEQLSLYLDRTTTPEMRIAYINACEALEEAGVTEHLFAIEQQLAIADSLGADMVLTSVRGVLVPLLTNLATEFGVQVSGEITLAQLTDLLNALMAIEHYEDRDAINDIVKGSDSDVSVLSDILELVGSYHSTDYMSFIVAVDNDLLSRIEEVSTTMNETSDPREALTQQVRDRLIKFFTLQKDAIETHVGRQLADGLKIAMPLADISNLPWTEIEQLTTKAIALEILTMLLASDVITAAIEIEFSRQLNNLHLDFNRITEISSVANGLLGSILNE